ncbi:MAG TPA: transglycosylase family protein [Acidimicrobiia bacterium]|nr:transglycosylase family protein [Acidimicrobiia bacterium]
MTRRERRQQRHRRQSARAVAAVAVTAVLGTIGALGGMAAASDEPQRQHALPRAHVAIEPSLVSASEAVQARAEQRYSVAVLERTAAQQAAEKASRDSIWDRIAACETQGNWSMQGPSFSGGVGFANSTWSSFGGNEFAPNAGQATREQQIIVAERVRARVGMGAWGCAKRVS